MLLLRNAIFRYKKQCGYVTAQRCHFSGTKKAPAGMLLLIICIFRYKKSPCGHATLQKCYFLGTNKKPLWACYCSEMLFLGTKSPCGHVAAQRCYSWGTKKSLRACYCSEMLFLRYEKAPAGMLLLSNAIFEVRTSPCGHVTAQKCYYLGTKKPLRACYCSEMQFLGTTKKTAGMLLLRNATF